MKVIVFFHLRCLLIDNRGVLAEHWLLLLHLHVHVRIGFNYLFCASCLLMVHQGKLLIFTRLFRFETRADFVYLPRAIFVIANRRHGKRGGICLFLVFSFLFGFRYFQFIFVFHYVHFSQVILLSATRTGELIAPIE